MKNRRITPYDTGARLQPKPWVSPEGVAGEDAPRPAIADDYGRVDFDEADFTAATVWVEPSLDPEAGYVLHVESHADDLVVRVDDSAIVTLDPVLTEGVDELVRLAERGRADHERQSAVEDRAEADRRWALALAAATILKGSSTTVPNSTVRGVAHAGTSSTTTVSALVDLRRGDVLTALDGKPYQQRLVVCGELAPIEPGSPVQGVRLESPTPDSGLEWVLYPSQFDGRSLEVERATEWRNPRQ